MYEFVVKFDRNNERTLYGGYPWDFQYLFCPFEMRFNDTLGIFLIIFSLFRIQLGVGLK